MNITYKDKFPTWCDDDDINYNLCLGDDVDSLLVTNFLECEKLYNTKFFYDFDMLYKQKNYKAEKIIGCDIDFVIGDLRCWGNHVTALSKNDRINKNSANLNNIECITRANYTDKYAGSTLATVLSYYDFDISNLSEEGKMLIMCIDSHFQGFYSNRFHDTQKKYLVDILEYPELYDIIKRHSKQDFINMQAKYNLKNGKIWINKDGFLQTNINLNSISDILNTSITLPKIQFKPFFKKKDEEYLTMIQKYIDTKYIQNRDDIQENIFSYAQTYKNTASFTYLYKIKQ